MRIKYFFFLFIFLSCHQDIEIYGVWKTKIEGTEIFLNFEKNSNIVNISNTGDIDDFQLSYSIVEIEGRKYFEFSNNFDQHKTLTEYEIKGSKLITKSSNLLGLDNDYEIVSFEKIK